MSKDKVEKNTLTLTSFSPNLEKLLESNIGMGKAQLRQVLPITLLLICEGA